MRIGALVQARMTSTRCPGKVLADLAGQPLLGRLLDRLHAVVALDAVAVATSVEASDDPIAAFCQARGAPCFRGGLHDVAKRLGDAAKRFGCDAFVRVCGDSPFLDPALVDQAVTLFRRDAPDFVTNCLPKRYPPGQSVEVVSLAAFRKAYPRFRTANHFEHCTRYFYEYADRFFIRTIVATLDYDGIRLVVDTPEDLERMRVLARTATSPALSLDALAGLYREHCGPQCGQRP